MNALSDTLYYALQSLETQVAMQQTCHAEWPRRQIVRTGVDVAGMMLGDEEVEAHSDAYITLVSRRLNGDTRETIITLIMMAALFNLMPTDRQARRCKAALTDNWATDIEDVYHTYCNAVDKQIDVLMEKNNALTFTISVMKTDQPQTIINVAGNYIAEQHIGTQILHADHVHYAPTPHSHEARCAEDIDYEEVQQGFTLITDQCRKEDKVAEVEAQIKAACQGSAIELWRVLRLNEALGYMAVRHLNTRTVYNAIQDYFGPLPYTERNFRDARNKK